ncbi:MAG: rRNA maturation RNase YbeY [Acidimicrobiales bacterium]
MDKPGQRQPAEIAVHDDRTTGEQDNTQAGSTRASRDPLYPALPAEILRNLAHGVLELEGVLSDAPGPLCLEIWLVDEDGISEMNALHMGRSGPTDVLSFPVDGRPPSSHGPAMEPRDPAVPPDPAVPRDPAGVPWLLGDVVICPRLAVANAARNEVEPEDEIALLTVHGILHLLGMDHETEEEAEVMEERERNLLSELWHPRSKILIV